MSDILKQEWFLLGQPWCHSEESGMDILAGDEDPHRATYLFSTQGLEMEEGDYEDYKATARAIAEHVIDVHNRSLTEANRNCWLDKLRAEQQRVEQLRSDLDKARAEVVKARLELSGFANFEYGELFEDGLSADLYSEGIKTVADAYALGVQHCEEMIRAKAAKYRTPPHKHDFGVDSAGDIVRCQICGVPRALIEKHPDPAP